MKLSFTTTLLRGVGWSGFLLGVIGAVVVGMAGADWLVAYYLVAGTISAAIFAGLAGILWNLEQIRHRLAPRGDPTQGTPEEPKETPEWARRLLQEPTVKT